MRTMLKKEQFFSNSILTQIFEWSLIGKEIDFEWIWCHQICDFHTAIFHRADIFRGTDFLLVLTQLFCCLCQYLSRETFLSLQKWNLVCTFVHEFLCKISWIARYLRYRWSRNLQFHLLLGKHSKFEFSFDFIDFIF